MSDEKEVVQTTVSKDTDTATKAKLPYHTPRLRKLGKVSELTDHIPPPLGGKNIDGGSFPNMYLS